MCVVSDLASQMGLELENEGIVCCRIFGRYTEPGRISGLHFIVGRVKVYFLMARRVLSSNI